MSGNKKLDQYAYVKILKDANSAVVDYDASADNFAISTGLLYSSGKMSEKSSAKLDKLLAGIKQHNQHNDNKKETKKQGVEDVQAEKPATVNVDSKSSIESTESESTKSDTDELKLSKEEEKAIIKKIDYEYTDKRTRSWLKSMLKKAKILSEEVESAEEEDDMSEEEFLEELGKELKNSRECKEAWNAHDNFVNPGVLDESPELEGTDNAVKECKPYKLVAHCKEENIDCEMKKPALEKPLLEDIDNIFDLFEAKDMKDDELPVDPEAAKLEVHTMLNDLVADEIEAINGYDDAKAEIMDTPIEHKDNILDTIDHIKEEEQEHIDELIGATTEIPFDKEEAKEEHQDFAAEEGELAEETHAKYAKPEGDRIAAYNNALKYAKKENKPFIYGYTQTGDGKFFALEQPIKVSSSPAEAEEEFRNQHKRCSTVYMAYPEKEFVDESLEADTVIDDFPEPEGEPMSDKELEEAMGIKEPEENK